MFSRSRLSLIILLLTLILLPLFVATQARKTKPFAGEALTAPAPVGTSRLGFGTPAASKGTFSSSKSKPEPPQKTATETMQASSGFAGAGVSIAFQNSGSNVTGQGVSIAFQNAGSNVTGQGISIAFGQPPTLTKATPLTITPNQAAAKLDVTARLEGSGFDPATVEVIVYGPGCSLPNCIIPNKDLSNKSATQFTAPFLIVPGTYLISVRNGSNGLLSQEVSMTVNTSVFPPTLGSITPLTVPESGKQFFARLDGTNFNPDTVEIIVVGSPSCQNVGSCRIPNSVLKPGGVSSSRINSAPFTLPAGTFDVYVRNGSNGTLSNSARLTINPINPTPIISNITFSTTPLAKQLFKVQIEGSSFNINTIQAVVSGPSCSPCLIENSVLQNKSMSKVTVPLILDNIGLFQIALRNGSDGSLSTSKLINVVQESPSTFTLSGTVGIWDAQTRRLWPLDGRNVKVMLKLLSGGQIVKEQYAQSGRYLFSELGAKTYDLRVTVEYQEEGGNSVKPSLTKWAHLLKKGIILNQSTELDIHFPPAVVLVHGIRSSYEKWYHRTSEERLDYWDQYLRRVGAGTSSEPQGFITITPDYRTGFASPDIDTDIFLMGGWEVAVIRIGVQIGLTLQNLTTGLSDQFWPPFYYIGHSQGGLVGRVLMSGKNRNLAIARAVRYMYFLGTPNSGSGSNNWYLPSGNHTPTQLPYEYLTHDQMMRDFNPRYSDFGPLSREKVKVFAGNISKHEDGDTDGVVPVWSVQEIKAKSCGFISCKTPLIYSFPSENKYAFPYNHGQLGGLASLADILKGVIIPHMSRITSVENSLATPENTNNLTKTWRSEAAISAQSNQTTNNEFTVPLPRGIYSNSLSLLPNQSQTLNFNASLVDLLVVNRLVAMRKSLFFIDLSFCATAAKLA